MNADWQTYTALLVVAIAATLLVRRYLQRRRNPGCEGEGCNCPTDTFKARLQSARRRNV